MQYSLFLPALFCTLALAQKDAPVVTNEASGASYTANLPSDGHVQGTITGVSNATAGVNFNVNFYAFPADQGPFIYHIHELPVPADGNCTGTGAHLDPYDRTESPPCAGNQPQTCQLGDLSGKHGKINMAGDAGGSFQVYYTDLYLSTQSDSDAFFGNRSVVIHNVAGVRIACANFSGYTPSATSSGSSASGTAAATASSAMSSASAASGSSTSTATGASASSSGAAVAKAVPGGLLGAWAVFVALFAL